MSRVVINSLPFATRLRSITSAKKLVEHDRKRASKFLAGLSHHRPINNVRNLGATPPKRGSIDATDATVTYTASVGVGEPPNYYKLIIDTGSSNTWIGAKQSYVQTSTSSNTGEPVSISYGSGFMGGTEWTDQVTLNRLVIDGQSIGVAAQAFGFNDVDGILGVGPADLTEGTVGNTGAVPTVTDNLYSQGKISSDVLGIFFEPSSKAPVINGELTFGGIDESKIKGDVNYVPTTAAYPASLYWGIDQSITYGNDLLLRETSGIVDTGTTLLLLASDAFEIYQEKTGASLDQATGLLKITEAQYRNLESMVFNIGGVPYELTPNAQIWPRALNTSMGGEEGAIYLVASNNGSRSGSGIDFINGFVFLQRYYSVFDTANKQVGFARTAYTDAVIN